MTIGIYTPIHKFNWEHLDLLVESLKDQSYKDWVWQIVLNGEVKNKAAALKRRYRDINMDITSSDVSGNIGLLKSIGVEKLIEKDCSFALELDYDDVLHPTCLERVMHVFNNLPFVQFVYSNFAHFNENEPTESYSYGSFYGWKSRIHKSPYFKMPLTEMIAFPPRPQYFMRIEPAPNHLRAFDLHAYKKIGGYDTTINVGDDHDLMCRFFIEYGEDGFHHINECLYYQRYDGRTTTILKMDDIQKQVSENYKKYALELFTRGLIDKPFKDKRVIILEYSKDKTTTDILHDLNLKVDSIQDDLESGGLLRVKIPKGAYSTFFEPFIKSKKFQLRDWFEENDFYILDFLAFKGWYKNNYQGYPV